MAVPVKGNAVGLQAKAEPTEGRFFIPLQGVTFATGTESFSFSSDSLPSSFRISDIKSAWIDASKLTAGKNFYLSTPVENIVVPGGSQGYYSITTQMPFQPTMSADNGAAGPVAINFYNYTVTPILSTSVQAVSGAMTANQGTPNATPWNENIAQWGGAAISQGQHGMAGSVPVVIASDQSAVTVAVSGTVPVNITGDSAELLGNINQVSGTAITLGAKTSAASFPVVLASDQSSVSTITLPTTAGGCLFFSGSVGATVTSIKASAGQLYGLVVGNNNAAVAYLQLFNKTTGTVTLGTTAPDLSVMIPANGTIQLEMSYGVAFSTAISFACTTTRTGAVAPAATVDINALYK